MSVSIARIAVEGLGPLSECDIEFGRFNLIYGRNETGKTYLVEFLLHALFRNASEWSLRRVPGQGVVTVTGLGDEPAEFRLASSKKLEDFWEEQDSGLPTNMARLLVVKGGELAMDAETPSGVGRDVLKTALSRERLLDQILSDILKTTQEAQVENQTISGAQMGELKRRQDLIDHLRRLDDLFEDVERRYSQGPQRSLELDLERVDSELEAQREAKRHLAFQLHEQREELAAKRALLPDEPLQELQNTLRDYQGVKGELTKLKEELESRREASKGYPWVSQAIGIWEGRSLEAPGPPNPLFAVAAVLGLFGGLIGALSDLFWPAIVLFALGLGSGVYYLWRMSRPGATGVDDAERQAIRNGYQDRFDEELHGLAELRARHEELREAQTDARHTKERVQEREKKREELAGAVARGIQSLTGEQVPEDKWSEVVEDLQRQARELDDEIHQLELRLRELGVEPSEYRAEPAGVEFDADRLSELEAERAELEERIQRSQQGLESLKQEICRETEDDISTPWSEVLANLRERRREVENDYRELTAEILGKIAVSRVLDEIRAQEDEKIREGLKADEVVEVLKKVTKSYEALDLTEEGILVSGVRGEYPLRELSTGAREQVLLALRLGFAARLAGGEPLFMLLDDAFQHSDWERREELVDTVVNLVREGWQVTYLTMDDHIRDLFRGVGKDEFGSDFQFQEIG